MSEIFNMASAFLGSVPEEGQAALTALCAAAEGELRSRLREGVETEEIEELFNTAADMLAVSMYTLASDADAVSSFKAGEVSVSRRGSGSVRGSAASLRRQAETLLSAYLRDSGFVFREVRG